MNLPVSPAVAPPRDTVYFPYIMSGRPDPFHVKWTGDWAVCLHAWITLVDLNKTGKAVPRIAESWAQTPNGLQWTFVLRPHLRWSDGTSMQPEQIALSLRASLKGTSHTDLAEAISEIRADGDSIRFDLKKPVPSLLVSLSYVDWAIVHPDTVDLSHGFPKISGTTPCSGPFCFDPSDDTSTEEVVFTKNPNSLVQPSLNVNSGRLAYFSECDTLVKESQRMLSFRSYSHGMTSACLDDLKKEFSIFRAAPTWILGADFTDAGRQRFSIEQRRQILVLLHDELRKSPVTFGVGPATGLLSKHLPGALSEDEFDACLQEIRGTLPLGDSLKEKSIRIVTMAAWAKSKGFAWLLETLKNFGLNVQSSVFERATYFERCSSGSLFKEFDLNFIPKGVGDPDPDGTWQTASKNFFPGVIDKTAVKAAFFETNAEKRVHLYKELAKAMLRDAYFLPLRFDSDYVGVHKALKIGDAAPFRVGITLYDLVPRSH